MKIFGKSECNRILPLLWDYTSRRLPEGDLEEVERHIARCAHCRRQAKRFDRLPSIIASLTTGTIPEPISKWEDVRTRILRQSFPVISKSLSVPRIWMFAGAAALLIAGLGFGSLIHQVTPKRMVADARPSVSFSPSQVKLYLPVTIHSSRRLASYSPIRKAASVIAVDRKESSFKHHISSQREVHRAANIPVIILHAPLQAPAQNHQQLVQRQNAQVAGGYILTTLQADSDDENSAY